MLTAYGLNAASRAASATQGTAQRMASSLAVKTAADQGTAHDANKNVSVFRRGVALPNIPVIPQHGGRTVGFNDLIRTHCPNGKRPLIFVQPGILGRNYFRSAEVYERYASEHGPHQCDRDAITLHKELADFKENNIIPFVLIANTECPDANFRQAKSKLGDLQIPFAIVPPIIVAKLQQQGLPTHKLEWTMFANRQVVLLNQQDPNRCEKPSIVLDASMRELNMPSSKLAAETLKWAMEACQSPLPKTPDFSLADAMKGLSLNSAPRRPRP